MSNIDTQHADFPEKRADIGTDARRINTDHSAISPGEIAVGVVIGRASEYFDFFVFAIASVVVFPKVFFPFAEPLTATLYSFACSRWPSSRGPSGRFCSP